MSRIMLQCLSCGLPFMTEFARSSSCLPCWKKSQDYDLSKADLAHIMLQEKLAEVLGTTTNTAKAPTRGAKSLSNKDVKRLLRLCHPDKHDNSELSTEVTKMLNDMRG